MFSIFASNFKFLRVLPLSELLSALGSKSRGPWFKIILLPVAVYLFVYLSISVCLSPVSLSSLLHFYISMELQAKIWSY